MERNGDTIVFTAPRTRKEILLPADTEFRWPAEEIARRQRVKTPGFGTKRRPTEGSVLERRTEPARQILSMDDEGTPRFHMGTPGPRYYLDGESVHAGNLLLMRSEQGAWQTVRFEWDFRDDTLPTLRTDDDRALPLSDNARFRWPRS